MDTKAISSWAMAASKSFGDKLIRLSIHDDEENLPKTITVLKTKSLHQVVQDILKIPPASVRSVTLYGKIIHPDILIQDLPTTDWGPAPLVLNRIRDGASPLQKQMAKTRSLYCRMVNETISSHWETFSHSTCGVLGYAASTLQAESPGVQMTRSAAEEWVMGSIRRKSVDDLIDVFFRWDIMAGDCGASHVVLMKTLEANPELSDVRWRIYQGGGHGLLVGVLFDGSLLLIDVGILQECVQFAGDAVINYVSSLGSGRRHSEPKTEFQYCKDPHNFAQLRMKTFHP